MESSSVLRADHSGEGFFFVVDSLAGKGRKMQDLIVVGQGEAGDCSGFQAAVRAEADGRVGLNLADCRRMYKFFSVVLFNLQAFL
jgi:hypothetical protein